MSASVHSESFKSTGGVAVGVLWQGSLKRKIGFRLRELCHKVKTKRRARESAVPTAALARLFHAAITLRTKQNSCAPGARVIELSRIGCGRLYLLSSIVLLIDICGKSAPNIRCKPVFW